MGMLWPRAIGTPWWRVGLALWALVLCLAGVLLGRALLEGETAPTLTRIWARLGEPITAVTPPGAGEVRPPIPAPTFSLPLVGGGSFQLAGQRGRVVVMNFWASWCIPCRTEAPRLAQADQAYRARGVAFVGIDLQDNQRDARAFLRRFHLIYPNGPDGNQRISGSYGVGGIPTTLVIDRQGRIRWRWPGEIQTRRLYAVIEELLR